MNLTDADRQLIEQAKTILKNIFVFNKHFVVALLQTASGKTYTGFNLKATATRASICAENVAIANAISDKATDFTTLVTVAYPESDNTLDPIVVSPCGICREILHDYAPNVKIILPVNSHLEKVSINDLLVFAYKRTNNSGK